jgi:hypothetical protein
MTARLRTIQLTRGADDAERHQNCRRATRSSYESWKNRRSDDQRHCVCEVAMAGRTARPEALYLYRYIRWVAESFSHYMLQMQG